MDLNQVTVSCADLATSAIFYLPVAEPAFAGGGNGGPGSRPFAYPLDPAGETAFSSHTDAEGGSPPGRPRGR